jgi:hypothetical protein
VQIAHTSIAGPGQYRGNGNNSKNMKDGPPVVVACYYKAEKERSGGGD